MDATLFENSPAGDLVRAIGGYWTFSPNALPPELEWDSALVSLLSRANTAVGTISGLGESLPNPYLLIYPFIKREAVLSSRIEGTQSSVSDLLVFEATQIEKRQDIREIQNYVRAVEYGLQRLDTLPVSLRLIRELHKILLQEVRGERGEPGEFRDRQNWIGSAGCSLDDATYVPPDVSLMHESLSRLEKYLHNDSDIPFLIELALIHYQFEAIHPFIDGNGRIGRLLITLLLCESGLLSQPLLYLSPFFEKNRQEYYDLLLGISQKGNWRQWIEFFLKALINQSDDAVNRSRALLNLQKSYRQIAQGRLISPTTIQLLDLIFARPVFNVKSVKEHLNVTFPAAQKAIQFLVDKGIVIETTGKRRNKVYEARSVIDILEFDIPQEVSKADAKLEERLIEAYMDIETTGLSPSYDAITVIGIYRHDGKDGEFIQLVGKEITNHNLLKALDGVETIYTYNGNRFDLPFIHSALGVNLAEKYKHRDLMQDCWENNLYGGLKAVERQLGIKRELTEVDGFEAVMLWQRYVDYVDQKALNKLLKYNKEDVMNLSILKQKLLKSINN